MTNGLQPAGTPCNKIPSSLLDPNMVLYAQTLFPQPQVTGIPGFNGLDTTKRRTGQDTESLRLDYQVRPQDALWGRYTTFNQLQTGSAAFQTLGHRQFTHGYNVAAHYQHTFAGNALAEFYFGRVSGEINQFSQFFGAPAGFERQTGFSSNFAGNFRGGFSFVLYLSILGFLGSPDRARTTKPKSTKHTLPTSGSGAATTQKFSGITQSPLAVRSIGTTPTRFT